LRYGGDPRGEGEQLAIAGDEGGAQVRGECREVALHHLSQDESPERASSLRSRMTLQRAANAGETCAARTSDSPPSDRWEPGADVVRVLMAVNGIPLTGIRSWGALEADT
jgi:hypothetical protein